MADQDQGGPLSPELLARVEELQADLDERLAAAAFEARAQAELVRRNPGVQVNNDPPPTGDALRRPFLPAPEKWNGEVSAADAAHATLGLSGRVWMQTFEDYIDQYDFDPLVLLPHFLLEKARVWYHHYVENMHARDEDLDWAAVREEFIRQYSPADRRSQAEIARAKLHKGEYSMSSWGSYTQYEQAFRNLIRDCPDMAVADQLHWFITGMSPFFRKACATQQDGTAWTDFAACAQFARGVEVRDFASRTFPTTTNPQPKRKSLTFAATDSDADVPSQIQPMAKKARTEKNPGPNNRTRLAPEDVKRIPFNFRRLYSLAKEQKWPAPDGNAYTPESFLALVQAVPPKCVQCYKTFGKDGECKGHKPVRAGRGSGGGSRSRARKP